MGGDKETSFARIPSKSGRRAEKGTDWQITLRVLGGKIGDYESTYFIVWDAASALFTSYVEFSVDVGGD